MRIGILVPSLVRHSNREVPMTTTTMNAPNGRTARKSLAEQIDRLDQILDGLADALQEAVTQAVQAAVEVAVREAVRAVLSEVLTSPEVLDRFRPPAAPPAPVPAETPAPQTVGRVSRLRGWLSARVRAVGRGAAAV